MEPRNASLPDISSRHRPLQRSCSVQPEVTYQGSISYPSRKKLKNPGRSLTEIFTGKTRTRASSNDPSVSLRRRTFTVGAPISQASAIKEDEKKMFLNRSFSEMSYSSFQSDDRSVCSILNDSDNDIEKESFHGRMPLLKKDVSILRQERESRSSQSDDEQKWDNENKSDDAEPSFLWQVFKNTFRFLFWFIVCLLIVTLIVLGFSMYFVYIKTQCDLKKNVKLPLDELNRQLGLSVIGQEIAVSVILNSLKEFEVDKANSPLILWMVGWSGSGKTHTTNVLRNVLSPVSKVIIILPSLYPQNNELLEQEVYGLYNQLDPCGYNVIMIDGWDEEEDNQSLQILQHLVLNIRNSVYQKSGKGKTIIVLCGTHGSRYVNREYLRLSLDGKKRKDLEINDFEGLMERDTRVNKMKAMTKSYVFVPLLPMEVEQVRMCIVEELARLGKSNRLTGDYDRERVIGHVIEQLNFIPSNHPLVAATGCKRVQPLLLLSLFNDADNSL